MKFIYKYLVAAVFVLSITSCDLDINDNPNYSKKATPVELLPAGIAETAGYVGGDLQLLGGIWSQHYAQANNSNQYVYIDRYNLTNNSFGYIWRIAYSGALKDLYEARTKSAEAEEWQYWIMAQTMIAFNYHVLVDSYGTIPFTEAINDDILAPHYDEGKVVNNGIIKLLDEVIAKETVAADKSSLGSKDFVFGGDLRSWIQFAKTLKLKVLMRDFTANETAIKALLATNDFLVSDARMTGFQDKESGSNPLFENDRRKLNTQENLRGSATMINFLIKNNDPRLSSFYEAATAPINDPLNQSVKLRYRGLPQGGYSIRAAIIPTSSTSRATLGAVDAVYFMSVAESHFLQAECYARLNNKVDAKKFYEQGVTAAFDRWNQDASSFLTGVYAFNDTNLESMIKSIIMQKWVASVRCQAWDAYFDINRTGYPEMNKEYVKSETDWVSDNPSYVLGNLTPSFTSVLGADKTTKIPIYPRRLLIPKNSSDNNPNAPAVIPLATKMWWHK